MESKACDVRDNGQDVDVLDGLPPMPTSIKAQMPELAAFLQSLAANIGRDRVQLQLKGSVDLRKAYSADDFRAVNGVYRRGHGWVVWQENGFLVGVLADAMAAFAKRHRGR
jgi:hypothetical protein